VAQVCNLAAQDVKVVLLDVPEPHQCNIVMDKGWLLVSVSLTLKFVVPQESSTAEVVARLV
jgi:hypothetical protein